MNITEKKFTLFVITRFYRLHRARRPSWRMHALSTSVSSASFSHVTTRWEASVLCELTISSATMKTMCGGEASADVTSRSRDKAGACGMAAAAELQHYRSREVTFTAAFIHHPAILMLWVGR
jgi:hypothetical protein